MTELDICYEPLVTSGLGLIAHLLTKMHDS